MFNQWGIILYLLGILYSIRLEKTVLQAVDLNLFIGTMMCKTRYEILLPCMNTICEHFTQYSWHGCTNYFFYWTKVKIICFLNTVLLDMVLFLQYSFLNTYILKSAKCQYVRNVRLKYLLNQKIFMWVFSYCETQL